MSSNRSHFLHELAQHVYEETLYRKAYLNYKQLCPPGTTEFASWEIKGTTVVQRVAGAGSLRFVLDLYKDETFADKVENFPFELSLDENIYMQVSIKL